MRLDILPLLILVASVVGLEDGSTRQKENDLKELRSVQRGRRQAASEPQQKSSSDNEGYIRITEPSGKKSLVQAQHTPNKNHKTKLDKEHNAESRVANGQFAPEGILTYQVAIRFDHQGEWFASGGGVLIQDDWILTAANCLFFPGNLQTPDNYVILAGSVDLTNQHTLQRIEISRQEYSGQRILFPHQHYQINPRDNDIALIKLPANKRFVQGPNIGFIALNRDDQNHEELIVGQTRLLNMDYYPDAHFPHIADIDELLVGDDTFGWPCDKDNGGPATMVVDGSRLLVGIISSGRRDLGGAQCKSTNIVHPIVRGFYTSVYNYIDWIDETIDGTIAP